MTETYRMASKSHLSMSIVVLLTTEFKYISFLRVYVKPSAINNNTPSPGLLVSKSYSCV